MLRVNYQISYGEVKVNNAGKVSTIKIHPANALCAFIYHYKDSLGVKMAHLWMFLADTQHINNIMKNEGKLFPYSDIVSVRLNVYYKEARQLVKPAAQSGYKVTCYYKEPKKK